MTRSPGVSVVIPALNEESSLAAAIQSVADADEIVVVDGGSSDGTVERAKSLGARVVMASAGRGAQMAEGAALTVGEWIVFLHADTRLGAGACAFIRSLGEDIVGGAFSLRFASPRPVFRVLEGAVSLRTRWLKLPYGDQAIFSRRASYHAAGGMPPLPIMEDVAFVRAMGRVGRLAFPKLEAETSVRRFERKGPLLTATTNLLLLTRYFAGADIDELARAYRS